MILSISLTADIYSCQATVILAIPQQLRTHLIQSDFKARMIHNSLKPFPAMSILSRQTVDHATILSNPEGNALSHTPSALEECQTLRIGEVCHLYLTDEIRYTHSIQFVVFFILIRGLTMAVLRIQSSGRCE